MAALSAREGYRLWSTSYDEETAISRIEDRLVTTLSPPLKALRLLDAGCGTGRRLRSSGARTAVGVDASPEMLRVAQQSLAPEDSRRVSFMQGDVRALPLQDSSFDLVWCRLVIGHVADAAAVYRELARVAAPGGVVIVTDFHAAAASAGHRRSFRGDDGLVHQIEHHVHDLATHRSAALAAGLEVGEVLEGAIGPEVLADYRRAGRERLYAQHVGLPVVLACAYGRTD